MLQCFCNTHDGNQSLFSSNYLFNNYLPTKLSRLFEIFSSSFLKNKPSILIMEQKWSAPFWSSKHETNHTRDHACILVNKRELLIKIGPDSINIERGSASSLLCVLCFWHEDTFILPLVWPRSTTLSEQRVLGNRLTNTTMPNVVLSRKGRPYYPDYLFS